MRALLLVVAFLPLLCRAEEPPADLAKKLDPLLSALRSDDLDARRKAETELSSAGPQAISPLHALLRKTDNIEYRERLARVVSTLAWRSTRSLPKQPVSFRAVRKPLNQLLKDFGASAETFLQLYPMLEFDKTPVTLSVKDMPADSALRWLVRVASPVSARSPISIFEHYNAEGTGYSNAELAALIRRNFCKSDPKDNRVELDANEAGFDLVKTFDEHEMVRSFIELLRKPSAPGETVLSEEAQWRKKVLEEFRNAPKVSVDFFKKQFDEAIAEFQRSFRATLLVDQYDEDDDSPIVTLKLDRVSFRTALDWTVIQNNLTCRFFDHAVHIGKHRYKSELECRVYDVRNLENIQGDAFRFHDVGSKVSNFISYAFDPDYGTFLDVRSGRLIVRADFSDQQSIEAYLNGLRQFLAQVRAVEPDGKPPLKPLDAKNVPGHSSGHAAEELEEAEIRKKLEKTITFRFVEKPLREAVAFIREETGANLVFESKLEKEGLLDSPITLRITDMKAEVALTWILRLADLQYEMKNEAALICKPHSMCGSHVIQNYYVRDLIGVIPEKDFQPLLEGIIRPESWSAGITSIEIKNGVLTILQHDTVQEIIEPFLDEIRLRANDTSFTFRRATDHRLNGGLDFLQEALKKKIKVDLINKPFKEALFKLGKDAGITVGYDDLLSDDTLPRVNLQARSIDLQTALESVLKPLGMEFALDDCKIVVGSRQYLDSHLFEAIIYNLSDLSDERIAALKTELESKLSKKPIDWTTPLNLLAGKRLILKQPLAVHAEVARMLEAARKDKR